MNRVAESGPDRVVARDQNHHHVGNDLVVRQSTWLSLRADEDGNQVIAGLSASHGDEVPRVGHHFVTGVDEGLGVFPGNRLTVEVLHEIGGPPREVWKVPGWQGKEIGEDEQRQLATDFRGDVAGGAAG